MTFILLTYLSFQISLFFCQIEKRQTFMTHVVVNWTIIFLFVWRSISKKLKHWVKRYVHNFVLHLPNEQ